MQKNIFQTKNQALYDNAALLVCCLYDQVNRQAILDAVLAEAVAVLQDLPCKNQNQLVLFGFEPPRDLFFKLRKTARNEARLDRKWDEREIR